MKRVIIITGTNRKLKRDLIQSRFSGEGYFVLDFEQMEIDSPFQATSAEVIHNQLLDALFDACIEKSKVLVFSFCSPFKDADESLIYFIRKFKRLNIEVDIESFENDEPISDRKLNNPKSRINGYPKSFVMGVFNDFADDIELRQELEQK
jgi:hypothetical protein